MSNFDAMFRRQGGNETTGASRRYGVDLAKVTNISDPDKLNRVKCKRVTNDPDVGETDWMYVCSPLAGTTTRACPPCQKRAPFASTSPANRVTTKTRQGRLPFLPCCI